MSGGMRLDNERLLLLLAVLQHEVDCRWMSQGWKGFTCCNRWWYLEHVVLVWWWCTSVTVLGIIVRREDVPGNCWPKAPENSRHAFFYLRQNATQSPPRIGRIKFLGGGCVGELGINYKQGRYARKLLGKSPGKQETIIQYTLPYNSSMSYENYVTQHVLPLLSTTNGFLPN